MSNAPIRYYIEKYHTEITLCAKGVGSETVYQWRGTDGNSYSPELKDRKVADCWPQNRGLKRQTEESLPPIPKALYSCYLCREDYSWPPENLMWSEKVKQWVCDMCWDNSEESHGEPGPRLSDVLKRVKSPA